MMKGIRGSSFKIIEILLLIKYIVTVESGS